MDTQIYPVPEAVKSRALIDDAGYQQMYERSVNDNEAFWAEQAQRIDRPTLLDPELVQVAMLKPENLTASALSRYVAYVESLGEDPRRYRQAFWAKLAAPLQGLGARRGACRRDYQQ